MRAVPRLLRPTRAVAASAVLTAVTLLPAPGIAQSAAAEESVRITLPSAVTFYVTNLNSSTPASGPSVITFTNASLKKDRAFQISVRAQAKRFMAPFGPQIDVDSVSWRVTDVRNGVGFNGTLGRNREDVYQSTENPSAGGLTLLWTLAPPPPGIASGAHTVTLQWRLSSVKP